MSGYYVMGWLVYVFDFIGIKVFLATTIIFPIN